VSWITLSPKAYRVWQNLTATHFYGDGYIVDFISHSAVRYRDGKHSVTLSAEPVMIEEVGGTSGWVLEVYLHRPLRWDESTDDSVPDEQTILPRIEIALKSKVGRYQFVAEAI
jgi:hypothetical protein